jgi:hypothetical protein
MATLAELDVMIKGDVSQLQSALGEAKNSILSFAGVSQQALSQLGGSTRYIAPQIQQIDQSFEQLGNSSRALTPTIIANNAGFNGFNMILRESHTLGYSMTRGIVSLTYGFTALGKEINAAKQSGQSWGSIFSTLGTQLFTMDSAVILAGSAIALLAHHMLTGKHEVDEFTKATEDATNAMNDAHGKAAEEAAQLGVLAGMASNAALSFEQRYAAAQKMQDLYPSVLGNLDKEKILTGDITNEIKKLNAELLNKALYEAASSSLSKFATQLYEVETKLKEATDQQKRYKDLLDNTKGSGSAGTGSSSLQGIALEAGRAEERVKDLTAEQTKLQGVIDRTIGDMKGFATAAGSSFSGLGGDIKTVGGIIGDLDTKIKSLEKISLNTGASEAKEKISAYKSAITELANIPVDTTKINQLKASLDALLKNGIGENTDIVKSIRSQIAELDPASGEISKLTQKIKDLGGSFEDAAKKVRSVKTIQDVLDELKNRIQVLNNEGLVLGTDEAMPKINAIKAAINELINMKVSPDNTVFAKLIGDISLLEGPMDLQKIHDAIQKQKKTVLDLMKKDLESDSRFTHQFNFEEMLGEQGDITNSKVGENLKKATADAKKELAAIAKMGQGIYQVFDSIFTELFTKGTVSFKQIENALGQLIAKLAATVAEAAILSVVLQGMGLGGDVAGGAGFKNLLKQLFSGGLKFNAEGGVFSKWTQVGNNVFGENGPEAVIPLSKLPDMMKRILGDPKENDDSTLKNILKSLLSFGNSETKVLSKPNAEGKPEITDLNSEKLSGLMNDFSKANTTQQDTSFAGMIKKLFNQPNVKVDVKTDGSTNSNSLINSSALSNAINNSSVSNSASNLSNSSLSNSSDSSISNSTTNGSSPASLINPSEISSRISESISEMAKTVMNEEKSSDISSAISKSVESNISSENIKSVSSEVEGLKNIQNEIRSAVSNSQVQNSSLINSNISDTLRTSDVNSSTSNLSALNSTERNSLNSNSVNNSISDSLRTIESSISNEVSNNRNVISQSSIEGLRNVQSEIANEIVKNLVSDSSSISNSSNSNTQSSSENAKTISSELLSKVTESNNELLNSIKSSENSSNVSSDLSSISKASESVSNSSDLNSIKQNLSEQSKSIGSEILSSIKSNTVNNSSSSNLSNINEVRSSISDQIKQSELIKTIGKDFLSSKTISENNKSLFDTSEFRKVTTDNVRSLVKDNLSEKNLAASYFNPTDKNELIPLNRLSMLGTSQKAMDINLSGEFKQRGRDMVLALNQENIAQKRNYGKF